MPNANSTVTVLNVINYAKAHILLKPIFSVGGIPNEPGMSIANDVLQLLFSRPFAWKFNRKEAPFFVTQPFVQDYLFAGACAFILNPAPGQSTTFVGGGGAGIGLAASNAITQVGTLTTVNTLQNHNFQVGQTVFMNGNTISGYNSSLTIDTNAMTSTWTGGWVITAIPTAKSFQFVHASSGLGASGAPGITDFGWLQSADMVAISNTGVPQPTWPIEAVDIVSPTSAVEEADKICVVADQGNGILQFRLSTCGTSFSVAITPVYQAKATFLRAPTETFNPWPDSLAYVLRQGVLAKAYRMTERFAVAEAEDRRFAAYVMSALQAQDSEQNNAGIAPEMSIMRG